MGKEQRAGSRGEQTLGLSHDLPHGPHSSPGTTL